MHFIIEFSNGIVQLSSVQEGWGSYTRSSQAELLPLQRKIQDADAQELSFPGPRGGLVHHGRPGGCLLPHPGGSEAQEVPQGLPVQGSSLWASSGPRTFTKSMDAALAPLRLQGAGDSSKGLSPSPPSHV